MPEFEVLHAYRSTRDGQQYGPWKPGDVVELTEPDADWVGRDSPGCLKPMLVAVGESSPEPVDLDEGAEVVKREKPAGPNRQHRGGANRGGS